MVVLIRVALSLAARAAALACAEAPRTATEVALDYFRFLGRDPIRTLPLLTPTFHEQHGLHVVSAGEARASQMPERPAPSPEPVDWSLDRRELGWLEVQSRDGFRTLRDRFQVTLVDSSEGEGRASVAVRVQPGRGPSFEQRFALVKDGVWRIDSVEQSGVAPENAFAAFVAHPTEAERQRLEASRRRTP